MPKDMIYREDLRRKLIPILIQVAAADQLCLTISADYDVKKGMVRKFVEDYELEVLQELKMQRHAGKNPIFREHAIRDQNRPSGRFLSASDTCFWLRHPYSQFFRQKGGNGM